MKRILIILISVSLLNSCSLFEDVCDNLPKADVLFDIMNLASTIIPIGTPIQVASTVLNTLDTACETAAATGNHSNNYVAMFSNDPNTGFQPIQFQDQSGDLISEGAVPTPSINGGGSTVINASFGVDDPGFYMIMGKADGFNDVDERNENNNGIDSNTGEYKYSTAVRTYSYPFEGLTEGKDYVYFQVTDPEGKATPLKGGELPVLKILK